MHRIPRVRWRSSDESVSILREYGLAFFSVLTARQQSKQRNQPGTPPNPRRYFGVSQSDDVLLPGTIAAVVVAPPTIPIGTSFTATHTTSMSTTAYSAIIRPPRIHSEGLLQSCFICQPATFWRRHVMIASAFDEAPITNELRLLAASGLHLHEFGARRSSWRARPSIRRRRHSRRGWKCFAKSCRLAGGTRKTLALISTALTGDIAVTSVPRAGRDSCARCRGAIGCWQFCIAIVTR